MDGIDRNPHSTPIHKFRDACSSVKEEVLASTHSHWCMGYNACNTLYRDYTGVARTFVMYRHYETVGSTDAHSAEWG